MVVVGTYKEPLLVERTFGENHPKDFIYRQLHNLLNENRTIPNIIVFLHPVLTIKPDKDTPCNLNGFLLSHLKQGPTLRQVGHLSWLDNLSGWFCAPCRR